MDDKNNYPQGWYPDYENSNNERYWDGVTWTASTRSVVKPNQLLVPLNNSPENSKPVNKKNKTLIWIMAVCAVIFILPILTVFTIGVFSGVKSKAENTQAITVCKKNKSELKETTYWVNTGPTAVVCTNGHIYSLTNGQKIK